MTLFGHIAFKRRLCAAGIIIVCLIYAGIHLHYFRGLYNVAHGGPRPFCHNGMIGSIQQYLVEQENKGDRTGNYPNVMGDSRKSMNAFSAMMGDPQDESKMDRDYAYVPGLRASDPKDLIFMYMTARTRFMWHEDNPPLNQKPEWLIFAPDWAEPESDSPVWCPEGAQRIDTAEFKRRLQATLSFLKEQKRPNWERAVQEHGAFLSTIKD